MGQGNGRGPFAQLRAMRPVMPAAEGVPIVGQAISISDYKVVLSIKCHGCGEVLLFAGKIGDGVGCQKCRVTAFLASMDSKGPQVNWGLRIGTMRAEPEAGTETHD